jgi:hypothetical protein
LKVLARGNPETSIIADVELTLANQYFLWSISLQQLGVFCQRIVWWAKSICDEIWPILVTKREHSCEEEEIHKRIDNLENAAGQLDAAFAYLNILHPSGWREIEGMRSCYTFMKYWKEEACLRQMQMQVLSWSSLKWLALTTDNEDEQMKQKAHIKEREC